MSLEKIADAVAEIHELDRKLVYSMLLRGFQMVEKETIENGRCQVRGLGVFHLQKVAPRIGRNPRTGERVFVEARQRITFRYAEDRQRLLLQAQAVAPSQSQQDRTCLGTKP